MAQKRPDRTLGRGHDEFWSWCNKGELRLQHCASCGETSWPIVKACEYCGSAELAWQRMSGRGRIVRWCCFERDYYLGLLPISWNTILVELEEGPLFISNPERFDWQDITLGMPVKVAFVACEDSSGAFSLPVFERAETGTSPMG
ncbi:MAG: Zn-ribbon domain-containing OB-fold protein [Rhizomicrobium sp.]